MTRLGFVGVLLFFLRCGPSVEPTDTSRPNFIVVLVDDLRWDDVSAYGHPFVETPHIDRIAREGARFLNAFTPAPLCSPSRASILTGQFVHTHGIVDNTDRSARTHELETFPKRLKKAGYETAFLGKWHMGNDETQRPGFDYWVSMEGQGEATDPNFHENGVTTQVEGYVTDLLTDRAVGFIEREHDKPFALFLAHKALHPNVIQHDDGSVTSIGGGGFIPAERHKGMYLDDPIPRPASYGIPPHGKPALERTIGELPPLGPDTVTSDQTIRERLQMLMAVDDGLGRLLESLERSGQLDDTMVVVMSDHGYHYGEHGLGAERRLAYEQSLRIPLLIRYPPLIERGATPSEMVLTIDVASTAVDLGAADASGFEGLSLAPLFNESDTDWRDRFLVEYYSDTVFERMDHMGYKAIRTDRYKYIRYVDLGDMDELYDLETDPNEMENVIASSDYADVLEEMKKELDALLE